MRRYVSGCVDDKMALGLSIENELWKLEKIKCMTAKEKMKDLIEDQPDDATYEEILKELAFANMVERGLADAREGRVISNEEMGQRIRSWQG